MNACLEVKNMKDTPREESSKCFCHQQGDKAQLRNNICVLQQCQGQMASKGFLGANLLPAQTMEDKTPVTTRY